jgi:hypothetical protein
MGLILRPAARRPLALAVSVAALGSAAPAHAPARHPNAQPIVVKVDGSFHWGDAGIGAAAGVGGALVVAGGVVLARSGDRPAPRTPSHKEVKR